MTPEQVLLYSKMNGLGDYMRTS